MLKKAFSILLLLNLFVLLTPRELWHDCDHHVVHHEKSSSKSVIDQKDCFACDLELGVCSGPQTPLFFTDRNYPFDQFIFNEMSFEEGVCLLQTLRGPPQI
jgi:hypothetical protein